MLFLYSNINNQFYKNLDTFELVLVSVKLSVICFVIEARLATYLKGILPESWYFSYIVLNDFIYFSVLLPCSVRTTFATLTQRESSGFSSSLYVKGGTSNSGHSTRLLVRLITGINFS